ncbi:MAG TPA: ribosome silencing factor [Candidatus Limnocylindrales bacterium]|nr:ribosome silencing factor [Candidatus Limnocylindrales bacterium]
MTTAAGETDLAEPATQNIDLTDPGELAHRIVDVASDKKGSDIVLLRTAELTTMADYFVIASGRSDRQVQALSNAIIDVLRDEGVRPLGIEGQSSARWVLIDYGSVIVHLFAPDEREYYGLERLWSNAAQVVRVV